MHTWEDERGDHGSTGAVYMDAHVPAVLLVLLGCTHKRQPQCWHDVWCSSGRRDWSLQDSAACKSSGAGGAVTPSVPAPYTGAVSGGGPTHDLVSQDNVLKLAVVCAAKHDNEANGVLVHVLAGVLRVHDLQGNQLPVIV